MSDNNISLVSLNENNKDEYFSLEIKKSQDGYVESPEESYKDMRNHAWNIDWNIDCICAEGKVVGYAMTGMNKQSNDIWLDRFMIDKHYQNMGYGTKALTMILERLKKIKKANNGKAILLSVEKNNDCAIKMYEKFGFKMTKEMDGIYPIMVLRNA